MKYRWVNEDTGQIVEVERPMAESDVPPDESGKWTKVYEGINIIGFGQKGNW